MDFATHIQAATQKAARTAAMEYFGGLLENPDTTLAELGAALSDPAVQAHIGDLALRDVFNATPTPAPAQPQARRVLGASDLNELRRPRNRVADVLSECIDVMALNRGEWVDAHTLSSMIGGTQPAYISKVLQDAVRDGHAMVEVGYRPNTRGPATPLFRLAQKVQ